MKLGTIIISIFLVSLLATSTSAAVYGNYDWFTNPYTKQKDRSLSLNQTGQNMSLGCLSIECNDVALEVSNSTGRILRVNNGQTEFWHTAEGEDDYVGIYSTATKAYIKTISNSLHIFTPTLYIEDAGGERVTFSGAAMTPITANGFNLGTTSKEMRSIYLGDGINSGTYYGTSQQWRVYYENGLKMSGSHNLSIDGSTLFVDTTANEVGIGTTSPSAKLDVETESGGAATLGSSGNTATGISAVATGWYTNASGASSFSSGIFTTASGNGAAAFGTFSTASGDNSATYGQYSEASGLDAVAYGTYTLASGVDSVAYGTNTVAGGIDSVAFGTGTSTYGYSSISMGRNIIAYANNTVGIGLNTVIYNITQENTMAIMGGKVGIGTVNPSHKLNVVGSANITGNITGNFYYGEMWYHNHTATLLNFAVDGTYYNLTFSNSTTNGFTFSDADDSLTVGMGGTYQTCYMASGDGQNNHIYFTVITINGVEEEKCGSHKKMSAGGDIVTMNGCCIISLNVDDEIKLATADIGGTGTGNYYSSNVNLVRIGD